MVLQCVRVEIFQFDMFSLLSGAPGRVAGVRLQQQPGSLSCTPAASAPLNVKANVISMMCVCG